MAENLIALDYYAFRGNIPDSSFMRNGYAIWTEGLKNQEGKRKPNPFAVKQGETYVSRMFDIRSNHILASYHNFLDHLNAVALGAAMKEQALIESLINRKRKAGEYTENVQAAERACEEGTYGLAYTFLLQSEEDFQQLKEDYHKKRFSLSHANEFWKAQYETFLKKRLAEWLETIDDDLTNAEMRLTPEQLVDEWIESLSEGANGITASSLEHLRSSVISGTEDFFVERGIRISKKGIDAKAFKKALNGKYGKTAKGRNRKIETQISMFSRELGLAAASGMGQELAQTLKQGKYGLSFNTGAIRKEVKKQLSGQKGSVQIKNDVVSYVATEIEIFPQKIIDDLMGAAGSELAEAMQNLEDELENMEQNSSNRLFRVVTNVKGYTSSRDLKIAESGSFLQRMQNLKEVAGGMPQNSMQKLIFMLANTMEGCIAEDRIDELSDYIAAVAVAWMWDDYTGLLGLASTKGKIEEIRMFASGGIYYSASQILRKTYDNLVNEATGAGKQFVNVDIEVPTFNPDAVYAGLQQQYPLQAGASFEEQQSLLAQRWLAMRNKIMAEGEIGIMFNQKLLEEINGNLSVYFGDK